MPRASGASSTPFRRGLTETTVGTGLPACAGNERRGTAAAVELPLFLFVRLELRLQGGELGEGRIGIGLARAALARRLLAAGEDARLAAPVGPAVGALILAIRTIEARRARAIGALGPALTFWLGWPGLALVVGAIAAAATPATAGRFRRRRGRRAVRACRLLGRASGLFGTLCRRLAARPLRTRVPARTAALVGAAPGPPDLDELRLRDPRGGGGPPGGGGGAGATPGPPVCAAA